MAVSDLLLDTCFLIDFEKERSRASGPAHQFLAANRPARLWTTWVVVAEFMAGYADPNASACTKVLSHFEVLPFGREVAREYACVSRVLRSAGQLIGTNDLWIAAAALVAGFPLVTKNTREFGRVAGLQILQY